MAIEWIANNASALQNDSIWRGSAFTAATDKTITRIWMKTNAALTTIELWTLTAISGNFNTRLVTGTPTFDSANSGCYVSFSPITLTSGTHYMIVGKAASPNVYFYASAATYNSYSWLTPPPAGNNNYGNSLPPSNGASSAGNSLEMGTGVELTSNVSVNQSGTAKVGVVYVNQSGAAKLVPPTQIKP